MTLRITILLSGRHGRGSNMAALADACASGRIPGAEISAVIGTHNASPALERAREMSLATTICSGKPDVFDAEIVDAVATTEPDLICLAGYMRKLPLEMIQKYTGRILNIHPALLPSFGGKGMFGHHIHEAVLAHGCKVSGATVHFVDEEFDTGPILMQGCVAVEDDDTPETLGERVLELEHRLYPEAVGLIAQGRVRLEGRRVRVAGETD